MFCWHIERGRVPGETQTCAAVRAAERSAQPCGRPQGSDAQRRRPACPAWSPTTIVELSGAWPRRSVLALDLKLMLHSFSRTDIAMCRGLCRGTMQTGNCCCRETWSGNLVEVLLVPGHLLLLFAQVHELSELQPCCEHPAQPALRVPPRDARTHGSQLALAVHMLPPC